MYIIGVFVFIYGAIFGSFFNVVIYRLPKKESLSKEHSHCPQCNQAIKAIDLIPILSYIFLGGKCRYCKQPISIRYPLIELITAILFLLSYVRFGLSGQFFISIIFQSILIIVAFIDMDTMEIMDRFHVFIVILAFINLFYSENSYYNHVIAFFLISIPFFLIAYFMNGMGGGDVKLVAVGGFLLGIKGILIAFFVASISGGIVALFLLLTKQKERKSLIAFGPFLCLGLGVGYLYGEMLFNAYIQLFS